MQRFPYFIPRNAREQAAVERMRASASIPGSVPEDRAAIRELLDALDPTLQTAIRAYYVYGADLGEIRLPPGMDVADFRSVRRKLFENFRQRRAVRNRANPVRITTPTGVRPRVLVADGDAVSRLLLLEVARGCGMEAVPVATVKEALEAMEGASFSLILLDSGLRDGHGAQVAEAAFTSSRYGQPRIIAVSADSSPENAARLLEAGAERVLAKPVSAVSLRALLTQQARAWREDS